MPKLWNFKVPRIDNRPKKLRAKRVFKSHKHEWEELTNNPEYLKRMRNVVGSIKRKHNPNLDLMKLNKAKVKNFIRNETRVWRCKKCGLTVYSDDMPDQDGVTK